MYEQKDGVSMGASLGPVLANIIMTECEKLVLPKLISKGLVKFYVRYVDDTLLMVKKSEIDNILKSFNSFDKNMKFTVDEFKDVNPHFLDLEICTDGLKIFRKDTHTGQYTHIDSYTPWKWKTAWIRSLISRANKLCDAKYLPHEIKCIKNFAAWNGFPKRVVSSIIKCVQSKPENALNPVVDDRPKVFINLNYTGNQGENLLKACLRKLNRCTNCPVNFITQYSVKKMSFFTNLKDQTDLLSKSSVVYEFCCPGCSSAYIGKTDRTLFIRTKEHATRSDHVINNHIENCGNCLHLFSLFNMYNDDVDLNEFKTNLVRNNTKVIDSSNNWSILLYKEAYFIKEKGPVLNHGLKASRELALF